MVIGLGSIKYLWLGCQEGLTKSGMYGSKILIFRNEYNTQNCVVSVGE
ncbi:hypothetical protein [Romboutsia sp.]